ncbi:MAG: Fe-S cluster assembly protein SufD [Planctomycetota bacterium]|jgi:Fe-S cluster assembly protein SufD
MKPVEHWIGEHRRRAQDGPDWVRALRAAALAKFAELGFPRTKMEAWRNTDVSGIAATPFRLAPAAPAPSASILPLNGARLVFVNGLYCPDLSSPDAKGVECGSIAALLKENPRILKQRLAQSDENAFAALNTAFLADGAFVRIAKGAQVERPIHVLFLAVPNGEPAAVHARVLVVAEEGSKATLLEEYAGSGTYLTNAVTELVVGKNARLEHLRLQREDDTASHVATVASKQDRDSTLTAHSVALGAALSRSDVRAALEAPGAEATLNGLYVVDGARLVDHHTLIDHAAPHTNSHELYKGILSDRSRAVFHGSIVVRPDAQKIEAEQENRNLLLSEEALVNSNPQLEIFADDVRCRHGSTIGQIPEDALYYLRARGIPKEEARRMLIHAFADDMADRVSARTIGDAFKEYLREKVQ